MRNREAKNDQTNEKLQRDTPGNRLPRHPPSITREQPGDSGEDEETHERHRVMNHLVSSFVGCRSAVNKVRKRNRSKQIEKPTVYRAAGGRPNAEHNKADNCEHQVDHPVKASRVKRSHYDGRDITRNDTDGVQDYFFPNGSAAY